MIPQKALQPSGQKPTLFCIGGNHTTARTDVREKFFLSEEQLLGSLPHVLRAHGILELAAISTCNRFELFGTLDKSESYETRLLDIFVDIHIKAGSLNLTAEEARKHLYIHVGDAAISHILRVASSLDSLVIGETQITGQFKDALELARQAQTIGPILHRLGQEALSTAKKIRTKTDISRKPVSISHAAIDLASKVYGNIAHHNVLLLGAGEMATLAGKHLMSYSPRRLMVANRSIGRAEELVKALGSGEAAGLDDLPQLLGEADIVIAATGAPQPLITLKMVKAALKTRRSKALLMVDISIPRTIAPECGKPDDVYLFDIDDLRKVVDTHQEERRNAASKAEEYVTEGLSAFQGWLASLSVKPTLAAFRTYVDDVIKRESRKTLSREAFKNLQQDQIQLLENLFETLVSRFTADASSRILSPGEGYLPDQMADTLRSIFPLNQQGSSLSVADNSATNPLIASKAEKPPSDGGSDT